MNPEVPCALEDASAIGDLERVRNILSRFSRPEMDGLPLERWTPPGSLPLLGACLCRAARGGHTAVVSYLLEEGVSITPEVMDNASEAGSPGVYQALLDHGWDINSKLWGTPSLNVVLSNEDVVKWHLEHGANPNARGHLGFTPLEHAAYQDSLSVVKLLVEHGADVRYTPVLHAAAVSSIKFGGKTYPGRLEIMEYLLDHGADINFVESGEAISGRPPINLYYGTALHRAVEGEDPEHVRFLLRKGADRNIRGVTWMTPLEVAETLAKYEADHPDHNLHEIVKILRNCLN